MCSEAALSQFVSTVLPSPSPRPNSASALGGASASSPDNSTPLPSAEPTPAAAAATTTAAADPHSLQTSALTGGGFGGVEGSTNMNVSTLTSSGTPSASRSIPTLKSDATIQCDSSCFLHEPSDSLGPAARSSPILKADATIQCDSSCFLQQPSDSLATASKADLTESSPVLHVKPVHAAATASPLAVNDSSTQTSPPDRERPGSGRSSPPSKMLSGAYAGVSGRLLTSAPLTHMHSRASSTSSRSSICCSCLAGCSPPTPTDVRSLMTLNKVWSLCSMRNSFSRLGTGVPTPGVVVGLGPADLHTGCSRFLPSSGSDGWV